MLESNYPKMRYTDFEDENGSSYSPQELNTMEAETFASAGIDTGSFNFG
jgi:hypothetical protein